MRKKTKTESVPKEGEPGDFTVEGVVPTASLQGLLLARARESKYDDLIRKCAALRHGETIILRPPKGVTPETFRNNVSAAVKRKVASAGARGRMRFSVTKDGKLAISCVPS